MKKIIVSLAVLVFATITVSAQQDGESGKHGAHGRFHKHGDQMLAQKLHFSDQQKEQLKNINSDFHRKMSDLKKNEDITVREYKTRMRSLFKDHKDQVEQLLTQEQKDQLARMKTKRMEMAKVNQKARMERMKVQLGLSDEQVSKMQALHSNLRTQLKTIHENQSLTSEQKHEQAKTVFNQQKEQLKTVLTAEQLQQLDTIRKQHHRKDMGK